MSGYHSVSVIVDAILKGVYKGDAEAALAALYKQQIHVSTRGLGLHR
jgi:hypothetical protein